MAQIQHSAIPDGQRHEPKGVSTATNGHVYVANGSASGTWKKVPPTSLQGVSTNGTAGQFLVSDGTGNLSFATAAHGSIYFYNIGSPYVLTYPASFTKLAPTTTANGSARDITEGTNARITYSNTGPAILDVVYSVCLDQSSGANRDIELALYKNGVYVNGSSSIITTTTAVKHAMSNHTSITLASGDYLEVWAKNLGGSGDINIYTFNLSATTGGA